MVCRHAYGRFNRSPILTNRRNATTGVSPRSAEINFRPISPVWRLPCSLRQQALALMGLIRWNKNGRPREIETAVIWLIAYRASAGGPKNRGSQALSPDRALSLPALVPSPLRTCRRDSPAAFARFLARCSSRTGHAPISSLTALAAIRMTRVGTAASMTMPSSPSLAKIAMWRSGTALPAILASPR